MPAGYGRSAWQRARAIALEQANGHCASCLRPSTKLVVHHIDGRGPTGERAFDQLNLTAICKSCHAKTHATSLAIARLASDSYVPRGAGGREG